MAPGMSGIVLLAGVMPLILGVLMTLYWYSRKVYSGFGFWVFANYAIGLSYVLISLRGQIGDLLSVVIGNALAVYATILIYEGTQRFFDRPAFSLLNYLLLILYILLQTFLTYFAPSTNARIALASVVLGVLQARIAYSMLTRSPIRLRRTSRTIALIFVLSALVLLVRGVYAVEQPGPIELLSDQTLLAVAFSSICSLTIWTFYFLFLNSARVELDLAEAGDELAHAASSSRHDVAQLALLEEAGRLVSSSLDENEILYYAVEAVINRFGYAEAAISMLVDEGRLELRAIGGTEDIGFEIGYRQDLGDGIIGHVGETRQVYVTDNIETDPYYFTIGERTGSAAGVPMLDDGRLLGVLYVESTSRHAFGSSDLQTLRTLAGQVVTAVNKARLYASTQQHLLVMTTLNNVSQIITSSLELDRIFQTVLQLLKDTYGYTHISIYLLEQDALRLGAQIGYPEQSVVPVISVSDGIVGRTVQSQQMQFIRDAGQEPAFIRAARDVNSEICVPMFSKGNVLGVINVEGSRSKPLVDRDVEVLTALAGPVAIAIENARLHAEAKTLGQIDGLTGLMNRRTFDQTLELELARAIRYECPLTLIILDIDEFKACNDHWGHVAGDAMLKAMARLIRNTTRRSDSAARYGGDEFVIILPNTALSEGLELAERLRVASTRMGHEASDELIPPGIHTISLGVASFPTNGQTAQGLLLAADHAELTAKKLGKNRVCGAEVKA